MEARAFVANPSHDVDIGPIPRDIMRQFIEKLYAAGAKKVFFGDITPLDDGLPPNSGWVVIEMPSDAAARTKIVTEVDTLCRHYSVSEEWRTPDEGQKYLEIDFVQ
jgi:hypothetical protein